MASVQGELTEAEQWDRLVHICRMYLPNDGIISAEDMVQEAYIAMWRADPNGWPWSIGYLIQRMRWSTWTAMKRKKVTEQLFESSASVSSAEAEALDNLEVEWVLELASKRSVVAAAVLSAVGYNSTELANLKGTSPPSARAMAYQGRKLLQARRGDAEG